MYFIKTTDVLQKQNIEIRTFYVCTTSERTSGIIRNHRSLFILHHSQQTEVIGGSKERLIICGEKIIDSLKDDGYRCVQRNRDRYDAQGPKIRQPPSRIHLNPPIAVLTSAATPSIYLFARGSYAARCLFVSRSRRAGGETERGHGRARREGSRRSRRDAQGPRGGDSRESRQGCKTHKRDSRNHSSHQSPTMMEHLRQRRGMKGEAGAGKKSSG